MDVTDYFVTTSLEDFLVADITASFPTSPVTESLAADKAFWMQDWTLLEGSVHLVEVAGHAHLVSHDQQARRAVLDALFTPGNNIEMSTQAC